MSAHTHLATIHPLPEPTSSPTPSHPTPTSHPRPTPTTPREHTATPTPLPRQAAPIDPNAPTSGARAPSDAACCNSCGRNTAETVLLPEGWVSMLRLWLGRVRGGQVNRPDAD